MNGIKYNGTWIKKFKRANGTFIPRVVCGNELIHFNPDGYDLMQPPADIQTNESDLMNNGIAAFAYWTLALRMADKGYACESLDIYVHKTQNSNLRLEINYSTDSIDRSYELDILFTGVLDKASISARLYEKDGNERTHISDIAKTTDTSSSNKFIRIKTYPQGMPLPNRIWNKWDTSANSLIASRLSDVKSGTLKPTIVADGIDAFTINTQLFEVGGSVPVLCANTVEAVEGTKGYKLHIIKRKNKDETDYWV